jgi:hypothetical protein
MGEASSVATQPCALLFDISLTGDGSESEAVLTALKIADPNRSIHSRVYRGSVLLTSLVYRPAVVNLSPCPATGHPLVDGAWHGDKGLYAVLVGDFVETCLESWNSLDSSKLWDQVAKRPLWAFFLPSLPPALAPAIDSDLRSTPSYIGAMAADLGNPLHRILFVDQMFDDAIIRSGRVILRMGDEGEYDGIFDGAEAFHPEGRLVLPGDAFESACPPTPLVPLSARGLVTEMRMRGRSRATVHERIAKTLLSGVVHGPSRALVWDLSQLPDSPEEVEIAAGKLTNYLLSPDHPEGKHKAAFFEKELGIVRSDSAFLHAQLVDGLSEASYDEVGLDDYGIRFSALLPVIGRNQSTATIKTGWIVRAGERASLVTAFPAKKGVELESRAVTPAVVAPDQEGTKRWQAIFDLASTAADEAARRHVPKPMVVEGRTYMDGECGYAYVVVADARRGFGRWLRVSGNGSKHYPRGYAVGARGCGQSAERALAYCDAFARVLRRNGTSCQVKSYLD